MTTSLSQLRHCIALYMTELRICRPEIFHFCFKIYDECITKWFVKDPNVQNEIIKENLQICVS